MYHPSFEDTEGVISVSFWFFSHSLRRNAEMLVRTCGSLVKMEDESSLILEQFSSNRTKTEEAEPLGESSLLWTLKGVPIPTTPLYLGAVSKLNNLLQLQKGHTYVGVHDERVAAEQFVLLLKVISLYYLATSRPPSEASFALSSQCSSGRSTPLTRPPRRQNHHYGHTKSNSGCHTGMDGEDQVLEANMAEEAFRVAVDAVIRLSTYGSSWQGKRDATSANDLGYSTDLETEVRMAALYLLTTALMRFRDALFNALRYLPALFPEIDARDPRVIHPLLTPLLWDREEHVRCSAAALVISLLRKLQHNFKYAEEPKQERQSFSSLASQSGRTLASLHDALLWALQLPAGLSVAGGVSSASATFCFSRGIILSSFSTLVASTPYRRCPHSFDVVRQVLELPFLLDVLLRDTSEEFAPATAFLCSAFRAESLVSMVQSHFSSSEKEGDLKGKSPNYSAKDGRTGVSAWLLEALLTHAASRVEVWRCVVQLARIHPSIVGTHFTVLMEASRAVVHATMEMTRNSQKKDGGDNSKNITVDPSVTLGECLRAWLHYMGYVWQSFDGCPADPALRQDYVAHRATLQHKKEIMEELVLPVLLMTSRSCFLYDAQRAALRCVAQVGGEYLSSIPLTKLEEMVEQVIANTMVYESTVRAEVFTTIGVWTWQYNVFDKWLPNFVDRAVCALCEDAEPAVRFKAAFALSNITSCLDEKREDSTLRCSPHHMQLLCDVAMYATQAHEDPAVVSHGIRMMSHLLRSLKFEELISELSEEQVGVAEGYFNTLLRFLLPSNRDAKLRWNAACALGFGLSREVTFEAEPQGATRAVERLCVIVCHDRIFKVRTRAATALAKVPMTCLASGIYAAEDLTPKVTRALCEALQASSGSTENYTQYKEQATLCAALRQALGVMITSAAPSALLQRVFAEYRTLLEKEGLL